jgi:hypothetical protein
LEWYVDEYGLFEHELVGSALALAC